MTATARANRVIAVVALAVALGSFVLGIVLFAEGQRSDREIVRTSRQLAMTQRESGENRQFVVAVLCSGVNSNTRKIRGLIVEGTKRSRVLEPLFERAGGPSFEERLRKARRDARAQQIIGCGQLVRGIARLSR